MRKSLNLLLMLLFATAVIMPASAQSTNLDVRQGVTINLEEAQPLQSVYNIPAADFQFKSVEQLDKYLDAITNNLISFSYEAGDEQVSMRLYTDRSEKLRTVSDWNKYLLELSTRYTDYRNRMNL